MQKNIGEVLQRHAQELGVYRFGEFYNWWDDKYKGEYYRFMDWAEEELCKAKSSTEEWNDIVGRYDKHMTKRIIEFKREKNLDNVDVYFQNLKEIEEIDGEQQEFTL